MPTNPQPKPTQHPSKLNTHPTVWYLECGYCQRLRKPHTIYLPHEQELLTLVPKFCQKPWEHRLREYLIAEFDTLDHSKLTTTGQIEILNAVHDKTGCDCLTNLTDQLTNKVHTPHNSDIDSQTVPQVELLPYQDISVIDTGTNNPRKFREPTKQPKSNKPVTQRHNPPKQSTLIDRLKIGPARPDPPTKIN